MRFRDSIARFASRCRVLSTVANGGGTPLQRREDEKRRLYETVIEVVADAPKVGECKHYTDLESYKACSALV